MSTIYIDGMDCSGKSTVVRLLKKQGHIDFSRKKILSSYNPLVQSFRDIRARFSWNSDEVSYALLSAILYDIDHAVLDDKTQIVMQESTLITKGYCMLMAQEHPNHVVIKRFEDLFREFPRFDYAFFLTVDKCGRLERLNKRICDHGAILTKNDRLILENYDIFEKRDIVMQKVMSEMFNAIIIDSSDKTPEDVARIIAEQITLPTQ